MPNRPIPPTGEIVLYQTDDGRTRVECRFADETLWMSQALMAELFQTTPQNITLHLKALYSEGEILETTTCKEYLQVRSEGAREVRRTVKHYSLDAILGVGYRIRSERGTQFRRWATERLREYLVKGFTMDDQRLPRQLPQHIWQNAAIPVILHFLWRVYPHHHGELLLGAVSRRLKHRTMVRRVRGAFRTCAGEGPIGTVPVWSGGDAVLVDETAEPIHAPYSRRVGES